jgi:hypothetical protein
MSFMFNYIYLLYTVDSSECYVNIILNVQLIQANFYKKKKTKDYG